MTIYTDKIIVSFSNNFDGFSHNFLEVRVCPVCNVCKEMESFISLQKSKEFNIVCRRCLDKQNSYRKNAKLKKSKDF